MAKTITLNRGERIWQYRENTWTEENYKKMVADYARLYLTKEPVFDYDKRYASKAEFLKKYTWDDVLKYWDCNYNEMPLWEYTDEHGYHYEDSLIDLVKEGMREDNYIADVCDEEYDDDNDEKWIVINED